MVPSSKIPSYDTLAAEYAIFTRSHDASMAAVHRAKSDFLAAEKVVIRLLQLSIKSYKRLISRSEAYRTHYRYVARLCSRLLSWNKDINTRSEGQDLDEVEGFRYYTTCYDYLVATSLLVNMDMSGKSTRLRADLLHSRLHKANEWKIICDDAGREAIDRLSHWNEQATLFLAKLEMFTYDGPRSDDTFVRKMEQWMDEVEARIRKAGCEDAKGQWASVRDRELVRGDNEVKGMGIGGGGRD
ncbi:MAG: hypothetical protein Q9217_002773 [Psora testacea]